MLTKNKKTRAINETKRHEKDTGSPEVQIGILTKRISELADHLKTHQKDKHSRRGLLQIVADRRRQLKYLEKKSPKSFRALTKKLGLKSK